MERQRIDERAASARAAIGVAVRPPRPAIETIEPEVEGGRFPIKRVAGEPVEVRAAIHADGHDCLTAVVRHRPAGSSRWMEEPLHDAGDDLWAGEFLPSEIGRHEYAVCAWIDRFGTWRRDLRARLEAGQDVALELADGADLLDEAASRARGADAAALRSAAARLRSAEVLGLGQRIDLALGEGLAGLAARHPDRSAQAVDGRGLEVVVDRDRAGFGSWYEFFPRSASAVPGRHGTFRDCEARLSGIAEMGFDVVYLPPIHPIGRVNRKGRNNSPLAGPGDPGSPWAIGSAEGGHRSVHPALGTLDDFRRLVDRASSLGLELALDLAFQCAPDHPWVARHPEWFRRRADGSIRHAENPPKKYEDIYPLDFECAEWRALWDELHEVVRFWVGQGVRIFRVDNPHTKPYPFWEELIGRIKEDRPDVLFLAEAFTRPRVMHRLARVGFSQSYTYFAWRNTARELRDYFEEMQSSGALEYFRPNLWPNTPDILTEQLQTGGRPAFIARLILAATLGANYGLYGPAFELMESRGAGPGQEEYLDSEKYQVRHWDLDRPDSLRPLVARVNRIRRANPALHSDRRLRFHDVSDDHIIAYSKSTPDLSNIVLAVVNLDPRRARSGWVDLPARDLGIPPGQAFQVHDLVDDARYLWQGDRHFVALDPSAMPAHIFRVRRRLRTERDFDYYQ
ncbi:MAG TPA: alpha-1,4-glucan--maltose-1-phosphate maltosyltransferase [Candidatus Polarisedimenticolia bacterium]|nr:alpha-1,4-glucan--maltose-1-phosphate maltosyltransferase [Candidatus Polarisedimenticolia bacterium]